MNILSACLVREDPLEIKIDERTTNFLVLKNAISGDRFSNEKVVFKNRCLKKKIIMYSENQKRVKVLLEKYGRIEYKVLIKK